MKISVETDQQRKKKRENIKVEGGRRQIDFLNLERDRAAFQCKRDLWPNERSLWGRSIPRTVDQKRGRSAPHQ